MIHHVRPSLVCEVTSEIAVGHFTFYPNCPPPLNNTVSHSPLGLKDEQQGPFLRDVGGRLLGHPSISCKYVAVTCHACPLSLDQ